MKAKKVLVTILSGLAAAAMVGVVLVLVGVLIRDWRSGAGFVRYRTWRGYWDSHADLLIVVVLGAAVMPLGYLWTLWDNARMRRLARKASARRKPPE